MEQTLGSKATKQIPKQQQKVHPGVEKKLNPQPEYTSANYRPAGKLEGKVALITGGDSGIGRSVACLFAQEGASVVGFTYVPSREEEDRDETIAAIDNHPGSRAQAYSYGLDLGCADECDALVKSFVDQHGRIDILVNNASEQHEVQSIIDLDPAQVERTFRTNVFGMFFLTRAALPHMPEGSCIINTTSVTAYKGKPSLLDYSSTKGAIVTFTRSLAQQLMQKGIRVNAVAPGPVWTPLIPSSMPEEEVEDFGSHTLHKRAAHPVEIAPSYVFLASNDSCFYTGQVLHPNGGSIVNG